MSQLVLADGSIIDLHLDHREVSNDTRPVLIPIHVLKTLVSCYYTGGGEPSSYHDRLVECGYNPEQIIKNKD